MLRRFHRSKEMSRSKGSSAARTLCRMKTLEGPTMAGRNLRRVLAALTEVWTRIRPARARRSPFAGWLTLEGASGRGGPWKRY
jgi:hypothetical protein